jgi:hypothetical protein
MAAFISVYHNGVVITNEIDSYEFVGMKEIFLLNEFLTLTNVVRLVRDRLGWMDESCEIQFEGCIDIGSNNGSRMKTMSPVREKNEWTSYVHVVMKLDVTEPPRGGIRHQDQLERFLAKREHNQHT